MMHTLPSKVKAILARAKAQLQTASDYQAVYGWPEGERVIHDILREAGVLSVAHVEGDPGTSQFNDGKRALGLFVIQRLRWSEGELVKLARLQTTEQLNEDEG
jgi:hypothetical protein